MHSQTLAELFYPNLVVDGLPDADQAATALHHGVRTLRQQDDRPWFWAPYVHIGP
jgi:CHAT domain-containing protein